jgi:hypothetical protein
MLTYRSFDRTMPPGSCVTSTRTPSTPCERSSLTVALPPARLNPFVSLFTLAMIARSLFGQSGVHLQSFTHRRACATSQDFMVSMGVSMTSAISVSEALAISGRSRR